MSVLANCWAFDIAKAALGYLPLATAHSLVAEAVTAMRREAAQYADEEYTPPDGYASWAAHPWFTLPPMTQDDWSEAQAEAAGAQRTRGEDAA